MFSLCHTCYWFKVSTKYNLFCHFHPDQTCWINPNGYSAKRSIAYVKESHLDYNEYQKLPDNTLAGAKLGSALAWLRLSQIQFFLKNKVNPI